MKILGLKSIIRVKKYRSYQGEQEKIASNILQRNFKTHRPNKKWATDVTGFNVAGNKLYLSSIIDLFNGETISYNLSERPVFAQITNNAEKGIQENQKYRKNLSAFRSGLAIPDEGLSKYLKRKGDRSEHLP